MVCYGISGVVNSYVWAIQLCAAQQGKFLSFGTEYKKLPFSEKKNHYIHKDAVPPLLIISSSSFPGRVYYTKKFNDQFPVHFLGQLVGALHWYCKG